MVARLKASGLTVCFNLQRTCVMHTKSKIVVALVAGVALGAAAVQGLHAQAKPKAYLVTESEVLDQAALDSYMPGVTGALPAGGGRFLAGPGVTKATAIVGTAPQRFGIAEFDTVDQAQAYMNPRAAKHSLRSATRRSRSLGNSLSRVISSTVVKRLPTKPPRLARQVGTSSSTSF